jgi:sulfate/thiosulfate transport system permease protein
MSTAGMEQERHSASQRGSQEGPFVRAVLILLAGAFATVFLLLPLVNVFVQAFSRGLFSFWTALAARETISAARLTCLVAIITVPLNMVFGVAAAWAVARFEFRGKALLLTLIDLPLSVSPVVAGLLLVLLFGAQGLLGPWLAPWLADPHLSVPWPGPAAEGGTTLLWHRLWTGAPFRIIFGVPGMALATMFVTLPYVVRELIPALQAQGSEQEQAALTLGASGWQTFWQVTLPSVKWGLLYGVILCNARAMGEFGAVYVVSGHIIGLTDTLPLRVEQLYHEMDPSAPFAAATLLAVLALITLALKTYLEWRTAREYAKGQNRAGLGLSLVPQSAVPVAGPENSNP